MEATRHPDPRAIFTACLAGDPGAWRELISSYHPLLAAVARRLLAQHGLPHGPAEVQDEAVSFFSELYLAGGRVLGKFRGEGSLRAYLAVTAANHVRQRARARLREQQRLAGSVEGLQPEAAASPPGDPDDGAGSVAEAVARCTSREQLLYKLLYVEGVTAAEAADVLGISVQALYERKHRFLAKMKTILGGRFRERAESP
ncbi:MAG: sigma-70 family RNA polymerase sigma factor [Planctomycetota bacterium]